MSQLPQLLQAKAFSDQKDYGSKHRILRRMLQERPEEFILDQDQGDIIGITHKPTNFKIHVPRLVAPASFVDQYPKVKPVAVKTASWEEVPVLAVKYAVSVAPIAEMLADEEYDGDIWVSPETGKMAFATLGDAPDVENEPWVRVKSATTVGQVMSPLGQIWGDTSGPINALYGGPRPVASALAGGLVGTGLGYAAGGLAEWLAPGMFTPGAAKTRAAILGGLAGAVPGTVGMALNAANNKSIFDKRAWEARKAAKLLLDGKEPEPFFKMASGIFHPIIPVQQFNSAINNDPFSDASTKAIASGLTYGASAITNSPVVSPMDVARMAIGMGTGYASATLVGRTFGALAGLSPSAQSSLQQAGLWAGLMKSVVDPIARAR
jgi:hypothetical protein